MYPASLCCSNTYRERTSMKTFLFSFTSCKLPVQLCDVSQAMLVQASLQDHSQLSFALLWAPGNPTSCRALYLETQFMAQEMRHVRPFSLTTHPKWVTLKSNNSAKPLLVYLEHHLRFGTDKRRILSDWLQSGVSSLNYPQVVWVICAPNFLCELEITETLSL